MVRVISASPRGNVLVGREGFEPPTRVSAPILQTGPLNRSGISPQKRPGGVPHPWDAKKVYAKDSVKCKESLQTTTVSKPFASPISAFSSL